jgi:hypothetical protein
MSRQSIDRRRFLTLSLLLLLGPAPRVRAQTQRREGAYDVDVALLYNALSLEMAGTVQEAMDRAAGRYEIRAVGEGARISNRIESTGIRRDGRWAPLRATAWFKVAGRESQSELAYDYERRTVHYRYRGETFFLRRLRQADDTIAIPEGLHVDDVMSAVLNYSDRVWPKEADGTYRTSVVRRRRPENEGPDDVQKVYRAEIVPFMLKVTSDPATGKPIAVFDLTRFSSWAREGTPGRIVFSPDGRPESITASLILGTSVNIRFKGTA